MHQQETRETLFSLLLPTVHHWPQWFTLSLLVWPGEPVLLGELVQPGELVRPGEAVEAPP